MRLINATLLKQQFQHSEKAYLSIDEIIQWLDESPTICRTDRPVCIIKDQACYITTGHIKAMIEYERQEHIKQIVKGIMKNLDDIQEATNDNC